MTHELNYIAEGLRILAVPIDELHVDPANARTGHALERIAASLKEYGQRKPIIANRLQNGKIEAGNKKSLEHISASGFFNHVIIQLFILCVWVVNLLMTNIAQGYSVFNFIPKFGVILPAFDVVRSDFVLLSAILASVLISFQDRFSPMVISPAGVKSSIFFLALGLIPTFLTAIFCSQMSVAWCELFSTQNASKRFSWSIFHGVQFTTARKRTCLLAKLRSYFEVFTAHYTFSIVAIWTVITSRVMNSEHLSAVFTSTLKGKYLYHVLLANLHGLWCGMWLSRAIGTVENTTTIHDKVDRLDTDELNIKAVFGFALELFRGAVALGEVVAKRFNVAGQLEDRVGGVCFLQIGEQGLDGGFTKAFGELWCNWQNGRLRHGGTPFGLGDSAVCLIKFTQINSVPRHGGWFRAYRALPRSLGSSFSGLWHFLQIFLSNFKTLFSYILYQCENYFTLKASLVFCCNFIQRSMQCSDQSQAHSYHTAMVSQRYAKSQGVANAVSVATGIGQEGRRNFRQQYG